MKRVLTVWLVVVAFCAPALAQTMYVGDITKLNVRRGKGVNHDIIDRLTPGEKVDALTFSSGWTKIRLPDGRLGWVVSRYLTRNKPAGIVITELKEQLESVKQQLEDAAGENKRLKTENQDLSARLVENRNRLKDIQNAYDSLKEGSKDYLALKKKYDRISSEAKIKVQEIDSLKKKLADTYLSTGIKWFLTGAGVLLIGILIGSRSKRKRSSLL